MTTSPLPAFNALTASAQIVPPLRRLNPQYDSWQTELWDYYDRLGEYNDGVSWKANTMSRVRLCAAEVVPGGDEPVRIDEGPAAEAVERLAGGTAGQAQLMKESTIHLSVPGECWLVGEKGIDDERMASEGLVTDEWWSIRSADEIKVSSKKDANGKSTFEVMDDYQMWRPISGNSIVIRIWDPHPRRGWEADSAGRHARGAMLKVDMLNKRIVATIVSRLAMNGFLLYDSSRLSTPENKGPTEDSETNTDPFAQMMVEVASRAMADPVSAEAIIPIPIGADIGDGENFDPSLLMHHVTFSNPMDEKLMDHREAAIRELARSLDMPADVMLGLADVNHWCVDDQTEILTGRGWLTQDQLSVGDEALTLNHETGLSEWQPVEYVYRADVVDEPMVTMERRNHSSLTTGHHRWPTIRGDKRGFVHSEDLTREDTIPTAAPHADLPAVAKYDDDLVALVAWFWTEGHIRETGAVSIAQSHTVNPDNVSAIRGCLTRSLGPARDSLRGSPGGWRETVQQNHSSHGGPVTVFHIDHRAAAALLELAPGKVVTREFVRALTPAQLELFITTSAKADGWHRGRDDIWARRPETLDGYELALILSGRMVNNGDHDGGRYVSPWAGDGVRPMKSHDGEHDTERVDYSGTIWCPVTANQTWLARRRGTVYYTGNTAWQIDESGIKIHIAPAAETIVHALTKGYLIPTLRGADESLTGPNGGRLIVWYDTSEVTQRPDRSTNTLAAYDRYEVSGEALRREIGADEDDAPDETELEQMILKRMAQNPQQAQIVLARMAGEDPPPDTTQDDDGETEDPPAEEERPADGPPDTQEDPPPEPDEDMQLLASAMQQQVQGRPELADMARAALAEMGIELGDVDVREYVAELGVEEFATVLQADPEMAERVRAALNRRSAFVAAGSAHENRATPKRRKGRQPVG